jgi:hypothetical protein
MVSLLRLDIINFSMRGPKERIKLSDVLPPEESAKPIPAKRMTAKRRAMVADGIRAMFAGMEIAKKEEPNGRIHFDDRGAEGARPEINRAQDDDRTPDFKKSSS